MKDGRGTTFFPTTDPVIELQDGGETLGILEDLRVRLGIQTGRFHRVRNEFVGDLEEFFVDLFIVFGVAIPG